MNTADPKPRAAWTRLRAALLLAAASALLPAAAGAQEFPQHPVRMVLPYPAGGPTDLLARVVALKMGESLGQGVVVDNKPGASGMIGAETVARAAPDGYTILANASLHVINPSIQPKMRYDAFKDFVPITQLADVPLVLVVNNASPVKTVQDLIAYARREGGALNFGSAGNASAQHLAGESFKLAAKVPMQHVPYKGSAPALTDLMGGQIQLMFDSMPSAMPFIKSGKLRAVAVTTTRRASALPDIPTVAESGLPGFDISTWYGLWAPRGTPAAVVEKLAAHAGAALKRPDVRQQYADMGAEPVGSAPADFARYNAAEGKKWAEIVRRSGAKADQ
ncbi:tripartite tricarboxylate transporter substrate binding protein [Cupriavidus taiwanensis]|uniref:tripartite tricarboxylate transporter substrate binding protein n=1 Tax=Cupriavidus taiwanensis TaxID=164546 RepID=UPI000E0FFF21|nr:putative extra-cytoplasmic solute receptor [Cupriavidus taiwanensis]SOY73299.1 putative extra-cytoplasmic solute receptor [Cupriavidus taiwanensis]SOY97597.1 putative extra-cytoplasmic solute receptor [Cupriavidus taiwanensis]SOZ66976.1 putative extra-cytoplasmic solute receptor [Cupriavidus taiwanensis]SOZ84294.1 putative extra-cytoplasmic solute receptor [Cupriavidus taiwanensis]